MRDSEFNKKVSLLRNGQSVEINGNWYKAERLNDEDVDPCHYCNVGCFFFSDESYICSALEIGTNERWLLKLVTKEK